MNIHERVGRRLRGAFLRPRLKIEKKKRKEKEEEKYRELPARQAIDTRDSRDVKETETSNRWESLVYFILDLEVGRARRTGSGKSRSAHDAARCPRNEA